MLKEGHIPDDWRNARQIPIPKEGGLTNCDNWRGVSREAVDAYRNHYVEGRSCLLQGRLGSFSRKVMGHREGVLNKLGVPQPLVKLIRSFHKNTKAKL